MSNKRPKRSRKRENEKNTCKKRGTEKRSQEANGVTKKGKTGTVYASAQAEEDAEEDAGEEGHASGLKHLASSMLSVSMKA